MRPALLLWVFLLFGAIRWCAVVARKSTQYQHKDTDQGFPVECRFLHVNSVLCSLTNKSATLPGACGRSTSLPQPSLKGGGLYHRPKYNLWCARWYCLRGCEFQSESHHKQAYYYNHHNKFVQQHSARQRRERQENMIFLNSVADDVGPRNCCLCCRSNPIITRCSDSSMP